MSLNRIILTLSFANVRLLKTLFVGNKSVKWLYLGSNFLKRQSIEKRLGVKYQRIDIAKLHDEVSQSIRHEFIGWMDELNSRYGNNIEWWFGSISSRNIYASNLFQYACYLEILERLLKEKVSFPNLIIVESCGLAKSIEKWAKKNNLQISIINRRRVWLLVKDTSRFLLQWGDCFVRMVLRWIAAVFTKHQANNKKIIEKPLFIVDTFVHDYCLSKDGTFKGRYFQYLHEYLKDNGKEVLIHPVLHGFGYNYFSIYKRMRISKELFLIQEDFLKVSDYFYSLLYPIRAYARSIVVKLFRNFDLSDIVNEEKKQQSLTFGIYPVLIYRLFIRLAQAGFYPEKIINWYENQPIDKALIAGCRRAFPEAKIIGAQIFVNSMNNISLFPCQSEVEAKVTPDMILETSRYRCGKATTYTKSIPCSVAAALRYAHVFQDQKTNNFKIKLSSILVLLPFSIPEAIELLETFGECLNELHNDTNIIIKGHPDYSSKELIQAFGKDRWPSKFNIFTKSLEGALEQASVVVSSNSSSMIEAATRGIPVIFVGRQTVLNQNLLGGLDLDICTECFSSKELAQAINKYLQISATEAERFRKIGETIRDTFFTPINEQTMLPFLGEINTIGKSC